MFIIGVIIVIITAIAIITTFFVLLRVLLFCWYLLFSDLPRNPFHPGLGRIRLGLGGFLVFVSCCTSPDYCIKLLGGSWVGIHNRLISNYP